MLLILGEVLDVLDAVHVAADHRVVFLRHGVLHGGDGRRGGHPGEGVVDDLRGVNDEVDAAAGVNVSGSAADGQVRLAGVRRCRRST